MKIEKLIFQNINSLQGKWEINFADPMFESTGLFAITGPTGSGKSTILDAISLALYGATPRLLTITDKKNELMTKGCGVCSSEIVFKARGKRYRASWFQNRSYFSENGNLQTPVTKLEVFDPETGEYEGLSDYKKKEYLKAVADATGLTFPQFCRSVLLAQGQFAAFLEAKPEVRAESLEQITGSAIFGEISIRVHKKTAALERKYSEDSEKLKSIEPLSAEDRKEKEELKKRLAKEESDLGNQITELKLAVDWVERYQKLVDRMDELQKAWKSIERESATLESKQKEVLMAQAAKEIQHLYTSLENVRKEIAARAKEIDSLKHSLNEENQKKQGLEQKEKELLDLQKRHEEAEEALRTLIGKVRPLDTDIKSISAEKNSLADAKTNEEHKLTIAQKKFNDTQAAVQRTQEQIEKIQDWLKQHHQEATLKEDRDAITSSKATWEAGLSSLKEAQSKTNKAEKDYLEGKKQCKETEEKAKQAESTYLTTQGKLQSLQNDLTQLLQGTTQEKLAEEKLEIAKRLHDLSNAIDLADVQKENLDAVAKSDKKIQDLKLEASQQTDLANKSRQIVASKKELIENAEKALRVADLAKRRADLVPGEPCPLCGSLEHPYCVDLPESRDSVLKRKKQLEQERDLEDKELLEAEKRLSAANAQLEAETKRLPKLNQKCMDGQQKCHDAGKTLNVPWQGDPEAFKTELLRKQGEVEGRQKDLVVKANKAASLGREINEIDNASKDEEKAWQNLKVKLSRSQESVNGLEKSWKNASGEEQIKDNAVKSVLSDIVTRWGLFRKTALGVQDVPAFLNQLLKMEEAYASQQDTLQKLSGQLSNDKNLVQMQEGEVTSQKQELKQAEEKLARATDRLNAVIAQRKTLFQDKDCTTEEKKSDAERKKIETDLRELQKKLNKVNFTISGLTSSQSAAQKTSDNLTQKEAQGADTWRSTLVEKGFETESQWKQSLLSEEEIQGLKKWIQDYEARKSTTSSEIKANSALIQSELKKKNEDEKLKVLASFSVSELKNNQTQAELAQSQKKDEVLQVSLVLEQDKKAQKDREELALEVQKEEQKFKKWDVLNRLIGSSNGKTFRKYAQGLTFRTLVNKANNSLSDLSSRFLLRVRKNTDLELDIEDIDLFNQVRPINNLSGGETFLVSLALALGLSDMAGQNVRIDSLFLDEGFGTLDDTSLQKVLDVLEKLHSQGKLIGVISHIEKIRETIFPQITVIKETGGLSSLEGCGVRRLQEETPKKRRGR